jgi:hypothetical protein
VKCEKNHNSHPKKNHPTGRGTGLCVEDASRGSNRSIRRVPRQDVFTIRETQLARIPAIRFRFISILCTGNNVHTVTSTICKTFPRPCPCGMTRVTLRMPRHRATLNAHKNKKNHPHGRKCRENHSDSHNLPIFPAVFSIYARCFNRQIPRDPAKIAFLVVLPLAVTSSIYPDCRQARRCG